MTIAVAIRVNAGVVLAADSAATMMNRNGAVTRVYNNACKLANLAKGSPVGITTFGSGAIGEQSMDTIFKDFRLTLIPKNGQTSDEYSISKLAEGFGQHLAELYHAAMSTVEGDGEYNVSTGFFLGGFSSNSISPELMKISFDNGNSVVEKLEGPAQIWWDGVGVYCQRLIWGIDENLMAGILATLERSEVSPDVIETIRNTCLSAPAPFVDPAMPIQDAIDLARFLVTLSAEAVRFDAGPPTVGGHLEVAAITKHEGFKWISRKHYWDPSLNPHRQ